MGIKHKGCAVIYRVSCFLLIMLAVGCQSFGSDDLAVTITAENRLYATESAGLNLTAEFDRALQVATIRAAETSLFETDNINRLLLATVRAGETPAPGRIVAVADPSTSGMDEAMSEESGSSPAVGGVVPSGTVMSSLAVTDTIRASDGCAAGVRAEFGTDVGRIYLTGVANNLQQGTAFTVEWRAGDQVVDRSSWTAPSSTGSLCIWFFTEIITPGNGSATLFINGARVEPIVPFTILAP